VTASVDVAAAVILAPLDVRLSRHDCAVMREIGQIVDAVLAGGITLDGLCERLPNTPREYVFAAVARLEDRGYLPLGVIR
jgi:hypothetical protein